MRAWSFGTLLLLLTACGGSDETGGARTVSALCDEMCAWPDSCYQELGVDTPADDCVQSCEAQAASVGIECLAAISDTINCLGTCEIESLSEEQLLDCQDEALEVSSACE